MYNTQKLPTCKLIEPTIQPDLDLLTQLLYQETPSKTQEQDRLLDWIIGWTKENSIECVSQKDAYGNLYLTKGKSVLYPCVVAHVDINQDFHGDMEIFQSTKYMFAFDNETGTQCGPGFDDKAGVCFALQMLKECPILKVFLAKDEEIGCVGTKRANMNFFKDCSLVLQGDRRSYTTDISNSTNGVDVVSASFIEEMETLNKKFGYSFTRCIYTDIGELKKQGLQCVAFNFSIGYFNEHGDDEILSLDHFSNAVNYGYKIIKEFGDIQWFHISKEETEDKWERVKPREVVESIFDWYEDDYTRAPDLWHHSPDWRFNKEDEDYIQDCVSVGNCPLCGSSNMVVLADYYDHCLGCGSTYNIPYGKTLAEVEYEIEEVLHLSRSEQ